jgi:glutamine phosphoribosylpyrophosphate amidotransferase
VPDSGVPAAIGYAKQAGIPFEMGLIRSHYVGRTFIEPQDSIRHFGVRLKLSPVRTVVDGKRVVVVDDSLVRGTTSRKIVKMLRAAGATEVHLRISAPPTTHPCFYGIDTPTRSEAGRGLALPRGDRPLRHLRLPGLPVPRWPDGGGGGQGGRGGQRWRLLLGLL